MARELGLSLHGSLGLVAQDHAARLQRPRFTSVSFILSGPSLNSGFPPPKMTGASPRRYSSIRPSRINVEERSALPKMKRSLPGSCFSLATSFAAFSLTSLVFFHSARSSVLEKTIFGTLFIKSAISPCAEDQY